jgi:UPF0271 protein
VDLSADMGEWSGGGLPDAERRLLEHVTTAHVACGGHAGDDASMHATVAAAAAAGVAVGAHPSYADREHFGRAPVAVGPEEAASLVAAQVDALRHVAVEEGTAVRSVKPHGALYHRLSTDEACASAVAGALRDLDERLVMVVPANSLTRAVFGEAGVATVAEGFCDRAYLTDGALAPRAEPWALVTDPAAAAAQAVGIALDGRAAAHDGSEVRVVCESLCVHGDTPGADAIAAAVRRALAEHGVAVASFAERDGRPARRD